MGKGVEITNDMLIKRNKDLRCRYISPLIKWYQATMSKEEKYKLGLMTYDEYLEWQEELANAPEELESADTEGSESVNHTFWEDDDGDRENLSSDSYSDFLAENGLDISNKNTVNVDELLNGSSV